MGPKGLLVGISQRVGEKTNVTRGWKKIIGLRNCKQCYSWIPCFVEGGDMWLDGQECGFLNDVLSLIES